MLVMDKARLRDEAELALLAFLGRGEKVARLPQSRAPVCVPVDRGRVGSLRPESADPCEQALISPQVSP